MDRAARLGIFEGLSIADANKPAVRADAFAMIYNAFYQLKELKAVPANEFRGVISERSDGTTLVLNQGEFKKEFKVNKDTVFVNQAKVAQKWLYNKAAENNYYLGSVVRVLFNKDGVVTHIIEMGNPVNGIKNINTAWEDLGNKTLKVTKSNWSLRDVKLEKESFSINRLAGKDVFKVTSKTVFYVADPDSGILTQVKDYAAAKALVADKDNMTGRVYLAYEKLPSSGALEARVVVFNKANVEANKQLVRVHTAVSAPDYILKAQKPGEAQTEVLGYDLSKVDNVWPYNYKLDAYDVVELFVSADGKSSNANKNVVIDYSEDPIFKVEKFLLVENGKETEVDRAHANAVLLRDKEDFVRRYDLPTDYNKFFGNEFTVGSHVQIAFRDAGKVVLDVVSVVNHDLRGNLEGGIDTKLVKGIVGKFQSGQSNANLNSVEIYVDGNKRPTVFVTKMLKKDFVEGNYVEVNVSYLNKDYNAPEILKVLVNKKVPAQADYTALATTLSGLDPKNLALTDKATIQGVVDTFNGFKPNETKEYKDLKALINLYVNAYNKLDADASNDITPIA